MTFGRNNFLRMPPIGRHQLTLIGDFCSADLLPLREVCGFGPIRRQKTADRKERGLRYMICVNSKSRCLFLMLWLLCSGQIAWAEPLPFPPSYQRYVNDTTAAILESFQKADREGLRSMINRDPLIARKALINLLRQPDKREAGRTLAELFPESCESDLEKPLFAFFLSATAEIRKAMLDSVELMTDAEYGFKKRDSNDRFNNRVRAEAIASMQRAATELEAVRFVDGEAYCLARWPAYGSAPGVAVSPGLETMKRALSLYEESGNLRGQSFGYLHLARGTSYFLQNKEEAARLFLLACEKGKGEGPIFGWYLSQHWHLAEKTPVAWLKEAEALVEKDPALRAATYKMLMERIAYELNTTGSLPDRKVSEIGNANIEKYRAMLAEEPDAILKIRGHRELSGFLAGAKRQYDQALQELEAAMELARRLPYDMTTYGGHIFHPALPSMLNARSGLKAQLRLFREAESDSREVLRLLESEPAYDATWVFQVKMGALSSLMWIYRTLGEYPLAIENAHKIVEEGEQRGDSVDWQLGDLAELHAEIGDLRIAEEYLGKAVRGPSYHPQLHPSFVRLAQLHVSFQLYEDALRDLDEFQRSFKDSFKKDPFALRNNVFLTQQRQLLTEIWLRLGQPEKALQTVQEIKEWEQNTGVARGILGMVLLALGRDAEAEKYFLVRLASSKDANWRQKELDALLNLGKICRKQRRDAEATGYFERALELCRQLGHRGDETAVLLEMSELAQATNQVRSAEEMARHALGLASEVQDQQSLWSAQYRLAQLALAQGHKPAAIEHLEGAVKAVEAVSGNIKVDLFKIGFLENKVQIFDELIALLAPTDPAKAFHYAERRRAQAFLESRQQAGLLQDGNVRGDLGKRRDDLRGRLIGKQKALLEQFSKPVAERNLKLIQTLQSELTEIRKAHTQVLKEIEVASAGRSAALTQASTLSAEQVQLKALRPNQALLEYVVQEKESFVFLVTPQSCKSSRLNIGRKQLTERVEKLLLPFSQLREGQVDLLHVNYDLQLSHELYRLLFRPVESAIPRDSQLVIVADDVLNYLPFESLSRSAMLGPKQAGLPYSEYQNVDWLVGRYTFSYALSASSLSLHQQQDRPTPSQLLAFGNPSLKGSQRNDAAQAVLRRISEGSTEVPELVSLPQAARESRRIGQLMSGKVLSRVLVGEQATEAEFSKEGPTADYLHFAVHSLLNQEQPYYSALVLAPDANSDGLLQTYEIVNTRLRSRLVTLSGCETALGKLKRGEGMLGLQRAFLQAGAESVVVSLWSIEDSTAEFMESFYKNIRKGQSFAVALRSAKQQYLRGTLALGGGQRLSSSHPFFWAPFVLTTTRMQ